MARLAKRTVRTSATPQVEEQQYSPGFSEGPNNGTPGTTVTKEVENPLADARLEKRTVHTFFRLLKQEQTKVQYFPKDHPNGKKLKSLSRLQRNYLPRIYEVGKTCSTYVNPILHAGRRKSGLLRFRRTNPNGKVENKTNFGEKEFPQDVESGFPGKSLLYLR